MGDKTISEEIVENLERMILEETKSDGRADNIYNLVRSLDLYKQSVLYDMEDINVMKNIFNDLCKKGSEVVSKENSEQDLQNINNRDDFLKGLDLEQARLEQEYLESKIKETKSYKM